MSGPNLTLCFADERAVSLWGDSKNFPYAHQVMIGPATDATSKYDVVVDIDGLSRLPSVRNGNASVCFLATDLETLRRLIADAGGTPIIFAPSAIAILDQMTNSRLTLVLLKDVKAGDPLRGDEIGTELGGAGLCKSYKDKVLGLRVLYNLPAGTPLGMGLFE